MDKSRLWPAIAFLSLTVAIVGSPIARAGNWGELWGQLLWGPRPLVLPPGLNLYAPTSELTGPVAGCFDLLEHLGGAADVVSIAGVDSATQQTRQCGYQAAVPAGDDFAILLGDAVMVQLTQSRQLIPGQPVACPATGLNPGVNLVGIGRPPAMFTCFDVVNAFATGVVSSVERLDIATGSFEACAIDASGTVTGTAFPIKAGEGYIVHAASAGNPVNLNDLSDPVCQ